MARGRGEESRDEAGASSEAREGAESAGTRGPIPEFIRRVLGLGLSGFFLTEEAFRRALGDTLPKDWTDFAVEQSARTREEFLTRLSFEIGRSLENVDLAAVLRDLLEGRTLEVNARIRLGPPESGEQAGQVQIGARKARSSD